MKFPVIVILILMVSVLGAQNVKPGMNNALMEEVIRKQCSRVDGVPGAWQVFFEDHVLIILTDESNNRMRIFCPIIRVSELENGQMEQLLIANFHAALDAKYGIYEGFVVGLFTHPLRELSKAQLQDAMQQLVRLSLNFGGNYSSTDLIFAPGPEEGKKPEKQDRINKKPDKL